MTGMHLIYFADPMCSWCWGFAPVISGIRSAFRDALPIRLVMGGLRPGTAEPMTAAAKGEVCRHWEHVAEASGQPFDFGLFDREGFVYDTDPAARAVVLFRRERPDGALDYLERVQRAFYAENRDVTSPPVLADLAAEFGFEREAFLRRWSEEAVKGETWRDYATSQQSGVTGFPTVVAGPDARGAYALVTEGYRPADTLVPALQAWLRSLDPAGSQPAV